MAVRRTIDEGCEDVLPVLLDQVVDVTENSAGIAVSKSCYAGVGMWKGAAVCGERGILLDIPHGENEKCRERRGSLTAS